MKSTSSHDSKAVLISALKEIKDLRRQLRSASVEQEDIAIIGMDCRLPGSANSPEEYWAFLKNGGVAIDEVPTDRWDNQAYYSDAPAQVGRLYTEHGGFLNDVYGFDAHFFGLSAEEAINMDPQQRLALEVSYSAVERAGQPFGKLKGADVGVFLGVCFDDYAHLLRNQLQLEAMSPYGSLGNSKSISAGRISYSFGFQGPSLSLDTSCSSSLFAVHLACQSLRNGESSMAIAGGVNAMLSPETSIGFCQLNALSSSGQCRAFDERADGYVRGEGCAMVVLKRLSDAEKNHDNILAVIKGSAVNHDGRSNGLTAPNGLAQESVIRQAMDSANVSPSQIDFIETHGTGTLLGDPIEAIALMNVFGNDVDRIHPLNIGSVKANIGHLEGAAGVAGLLKAVLSLKHQQIAPQVAFDSPNPHIPWEDSVLSISRNAQAWKRRPDQLQRLAGVSSFGMSGTNAHIVLGEAAHSTKNSMQPGFNRNEMDHSTSGSHSLSKNIASSLVERPRPMSMLMLSAKSYKALLTLISRVMEYIEAKPDVDVERICHTYALGRAHYQHRVAVVAETSQDLHTKLVSAHGAISSKNGEKVQSEKFTQTVFMFSGQGGDHYNLAYVLYRHEEYYREQVNRCSDLITGIDPALHGILQCFMQPPQLTVNHESENGSSRYVTSALNENEELKTEKLDQLQLFVFEYALSKLYISWGVKIDAMIGHSLGEYVAACISGVLSLSDALEVMMKRQVLMESTEQGAMMAVRMKEEDLLPSLERWNLKCQSARTGVSTNTYESLSLAALNSPEQCVVSGRKQAISQWSESYLPEGSQFRWLPTERAFHSSLMDPVTEEFDQYMSGVDLKEPTIAYVSNISGGWITADDVRNSSYWGDHIRKTVRFSDGVRTILERSVNTVFLEIGPSDILTQMCRAQRQECAFAVPTQANRYAVEQVGSSDHGCSRISYAAVLSALARLWEGGVEIDWACFYKGRRQILIDMPPHPFQYKRYSILGNSAKVDSDTNGEVNDRISFQKEFAGTGEIEQQLLGLLSTQLGLDAIDSDSNLFMQGCDSIMALHFINRVNQLYDVSLSHNQLLAVPTVASLAIFIESSQADPTPKGQSLAGEGKLADELSEMQSLDTRCMIKLQPSGDRTPLFFVHPAGGTTFCYTGFAAEMGLEQPVYGIEDPNLYAPHNFSSFEEKAAHYIRLVKSVQPRGPYNIAGYSYGGNMAFEMARQLSGSGDKVDFVALLDSFPAVSYANLTTDDNAILAAVAHMYCIIFDKKEIDWVGMLDGLPWSQRIDTILTEVSRDKHGMDIPPGSISREMLQVAVDNFKELHQHQPSSKYTGVIDYFWAREKIPGKLTTLLNYQIPDELIDDGWGKLASEKINRHFVDGHHFTMFQGEKGEDLINTFSESFHSTQTVLVD